MLNLTIDFDVFDILFEYFGEKLIYCDEIFSCICIRIFLFNDLLLLVSITYTQVIISRLQPRAVNQQIGKRKKCALESLTL